MTVGTAIRALPLGVLTWIVTYGGLYFVLGSSRAGDRLGPVPVALVLALSSVGLAIPSLPASLGAYQAAFVFAGFVVGMPEVDALAGSILYQIAWIVVTSGLGLVSMIWEGVSVGDVLRQRPATNTVHC
jgi:uncharacterized membrane protein YbhN (UPF0104 family)